MFFSDLDGPILDVSERYYKAYIDALGKIGGSALRKDEYWQLKRTKVSDYDILCRTSSECFLEEFKSKRNSLIEEKKLLCLDSVWQELGELYPRLFERVPTVLITLRTYSERTIWQLKNLGIYSWFNLVLSQPPSSDDLEKRWHVKVKAINESGVLKSVKSSDCVFIGDTETDILAGKHLKMKTIAVSFGIRSREILLSLKPDLLFDEPYELVNYFKKFYL